ncbi:protein of unknown function [Methanoculleus bourgensis]|uniref:Uncharacterized protein n=1 Tax=Methanoculleus bourgensis TaxID=83986 RepID=A0A0X3BQ77_9EURY|nr:protein of unknown function [Methanoculleus bourgensis]
MIRPCLDESPQRGNRGVGRSGVLERSRRPDQNNSKEHPNTFGLSAQIAIPTSFVNSSRSHTSA